MELLVSILISTAVAATPLVFAATGELVAERAGVLNLGVEGMMVIGAIAAFSALVGTGNVALAVLAAMAAGAVMAGLFGVLALTLRANQVASGLALTMFGLGLSALWGQGFSGRSVPAFPRLDVPVLSDLPLVGRLLFSHDLLLYLSIALVAGVAFVLARTRLGLILRAVGENHDAAHAIGYPVVAYRYGALAFGGAMAGLGGAYLSLVQIPIWAEKLTAGRGWIALALVVFAAWRPWRLLAGAYLFGGITILQLHSQAIGLKVDAQILSMLPYLATILVLVIISRDKMRAGLTAPACLGKPFHAPS
jgi:general nucleoside transport system permease protein